MQSKDAFILGFDGLPWDLIRRWSNEGELEHFARLFKEGAAGPLWSTTPPETALAWPSISTGLRADEHGIYDFQKLRDDYTHRMHTSQDRDGRPLWDYLTPAVVGNVPMTYPAAEIDGKMVTGMMTPDLNDRYTHPPELRTEIEQAIPDYQVGLRWTEYIDAPDELVDDLETSVEERRTLMRLLMDTDDWRLFFFVYTAPDRLQHLIWDESVLLDHYQHLDQILREVIEYVERRDANLFVVSDHGFGPVSKNVYPNRVLEKNGYLKRKQQSGKRGLLSEVGVTKDAVRSTLDRLGIDLSKLVASLPETVTDTIAKEVPGEHPLYDVDFDETTAFFHGTSNLYVNRTDRFERGTVRPDEVDEVKRDLIETFESVTDPRTGDHVFELVDGDVLFPEDHRAPDFVVEGRGAYHPQSGLSDRIIGEMGGMDATHDHEGIFFALGPSIEPGARLTEATVYDVAPTVLHSVGEPIPEHMNGTVLQTALSVGEEPVRRAGGATPRRVSAHDHEDDFADVEERLRGLGYME